VTDAERRSILDAVCGELSHRCWFMHRDLLQVVVQNAFNSAHAEYKSLLVNQYLRFSTVT
jgi:hypothetical protein